HNSGIIKDCSRNTESSCVVFWLPCFHDMGLIGCVVQPVYGNFRGVMMSPAHFIQKPARWFSAMTKYLCTLSVSPNFGFEYCTSRIKDEELEGIDLSSVYSLYNGSEPIHPGTLEEFVDRFSSVGFAKEKMFPCYGLAEATLAVTVSKAGQYASLKVDEQALNENRIELANGDNLVEIVSTGKPQAETKVKLIDRNTMEERGENEIGEIVVAGKSVMSGYYNRGESDSEIFIEVGGNTYLRTGDLGFLRNGDLFVTGRIKDLIIIRGKNHYPHDIERTVAAADESLESNSSAAFSIVENGYEKLVVAAEVRRSALRKTDFDAIITKIASTISRQHGISAHDVVLVKPGTIPKTTSGKIRRNSCKEIWLSNSFNPLANLKRV
ncbi:MAG: AMP-binding protein, partial [Pyrinomonadaceae bacterium]|nr:AMP-binding protein [Pyrinomonadaceae bacterium]